MKRWIMRSRLGFVKRSFASQAGSAISLAAMLCLLMACSALSQPTPTATPSPTPSPSATPTASHTPSPMPSPTPTFTVTPSLTPSDTPVPTPTPTPTITPWPESPYVFDNWDVAELPDSIKDGIANQMIAFLSVNRQESIANIATAQPFTGVQTVYFASPYSARSRIPVLELESNARLELFLAPPGNALAYVVSNGDPRTDGLYILDLATGFSARVLAGSNPLTQRGSYMPPSWSPDGSQLALALASGYDIDIFLYAKDGSGRTRVASQASFDFHPSFSPDGSAIAFVSDRATCPSWRPGDIDACDARTEPTPRSGQVYLYELASGSVSLIADLPVSEAPRWINKTMLSLASGDPFDLLNPQRRIWRLDISDGDLREIRLADSPDEASILSERWSPTGSAALAHETGRANRLLLLGADSQLLGADESLVFPRYGLSAAWSPDGARIAIGGTGGHCPYGVRVTDSRLGRVASANPPPTMCDPHYSPDGQFIAFAGVNPRLDGRNDIYVASANGFGASSITSDLRGQVALLGWVGGSG